MTSVRVARCVSRGTPKRLRHISGVGNLESSEVLGRIADIALHRDVLVIRVDGIHFGVPRNGNPGDEVDSSLGIVGQSVAGVIRRIYSAVTQVDCCGSSPRTSKYMRGNPAVGLVSGRTV